MSRAVGGGRNRYLAIFAVVFALSLPFPTHAADGFFSNLWCDITGFFGFNCEAEISLPIPDFTNDVKVVETTVSTTIPPAPEEAEHYTESTDSTGRVVYTTVVHNHYYTNPTTIIRESSGGGGGSSDGISRDLFRRQVDVILDNIGESINSLQDDLAESLTTITLAVSGNASITGNLDVGGILNAGSLFVSSLSSGSAVEAPYFTATSTTQASAFPYASTTAISSSYASSTNGFFGNLSIGSLTGVLKATAGAVSAAAVNLASEVTGVLQVANGGTGWASIASGFIPFGNGGSALATSTALSFDGTKFITTYASTTALTVSGSAYLATSGGNVGIGTTNPGSKLEVQGTAAFQLFNATSTTGTSTIASGQGFTIGSSQFVLQQGSGRVGIGTASPLNALHISYNNGAADGLRLQNTNTGGRIWGITENTAVGNGKLALFDYNAGLARMVIDSTGNVGIGTTTPAQRLHVATDSNSIQIPVRFENANTGNAVEARMQLVSGTAIGQFQLFGSGHATTPRLFRISGSSDGGDMRFATLGNDQMTITSTGNVGIGTTSPSTKLHIAPVLYANNQAGGILLSNTSNALFDSSIFVRSDSGGNPRLSFSGPGLTDSMVISATGNVGIGTTSPWRNLSVAGTAAFSGLVNDSTGYYVCLNTTTGQMATSTTACGASSERFKENVEPLAYGLDALLALNPVSFDYKQNYIPNAPHQIGFIAEEVDGIIPELIARAGSTIQGLDYPKFTAVIVKAFQDFYDTVMSKFAAQDDNNAQQAAALEALEARVRELESKEGIDSPAPEPEENIDTPPDEMPDETLEEPTEEPQPESEEEPTPEPEAPTEPVSP